MSFNRPFPTHPTLSAIAIAYRNDAMEMLHTKVLPTVPVMSERYSWSSYPIEEAFTVPELQVGRKSSPGQIEFTSEENEGRVRHYGIDDVIPITDIDEAKHARETRRSKYNPESAAVEGLTRIILLGREIRAASLVQDSENYDTSRRITLKGKDQFSDFENSDPFGVLNEAMTKPLIYRANTVVMGQAVWETIKRHPRLLKAAKGGNSQEGAISRAQFAELMEIAPENLLIGVTMVNKARKGQAVDLTRVWGNFISMFYISPVKAAPDDNTLTWGFTAEYETRQTGLIPAPEVGLKGGMRIRVGEMVEEVVCGKSLGCLIQNVIAQK